MFGAAVFLFLPQNEIKKKIHRNRGGSVEVVEGIYFCNKEEMGEYGSFEQTLLHSPPHHETAKNGRS